MKILLTLLLLTFFITGRSFSQIDSTDSLKNSINPDSIYTEVDIPAEHPKGKEARIHFIERNINGAIGLRNGAPTGTYKIRIACIVDTDGKFIALVPETHEGYGMEKELIRVLKKLPTLNPALKNGVAVKSKIVFPVTFISKGITN